MRKSSPKDSSLAALVGMLLGGIFDNLFTSIGGLSALTNYDDHTNPPVDTSFTEEEIEFLDECEDLDFF